MIRFLCFATCLVASVGCQRPKEDLLREHAWFSAEGNKEAMAEVEKQLLDPITLASLHNGVLPKNSIESQYLGRLSFLRRIEKFRNKDSIEAFKKGEFARIRTALLRKSSAPENIINLSLRHSQKYCELRLGSAAHKSVILGFTEAECLVYRTGDVTSVPEIFALEKGWITEVPEFSDRNNIKYKLVDVEIKQLGDQFSSLTVQVSSAATDEEIFQQTSHVKLSANPDELKYCHFNGPLQMSASPRGGGPPSARSLRLGGVITNFYTFVGTFNREDGSFATISSSNVLSDSAIYPEARIEFPMPDGHAPIIKEYVLNLRGKNGFMFYQEITPPKGVVTGTAKVTLSFDNWPEGNVASSTFEVPVLPAP